MWYAAGDQPITSTQGEQTNPSTATLLAELTGLKDKNYECRLLIGGSTTATYLLEQATSSGLAAANLREGGQYLGIRTFYGVTQTAQYVLRFQGVSGDRVRVRCSGFTGVSAATIQLEVLA
jgi:hypothetical protein